jgi:catechol 2,3-dioxygenase-like lactoylglutathione lyase family enzyme
MHKSKLAGFIIDCKTPDLMQAAEFWSAALGMELVRLPAEEGEKYVRLLDPASELHIEVQKVQHDSRVHLDIETDDIPAEVARLLACGATVVEQLPRWCVMEAPTGQRFCIVKNRSAAFEEVARQW